jgi:hypothetical protein
MTQPGSLSPQQVNAFHAKSDKDSSKVAQHHTLGPDANQASPGDHKHDGRSSKAILAGVTITGSRTSGAALNNLLNALTDLGLTNSSSA